MKRNKQSQTKHDSLVKRISKELENKGFTVEADVPGYHSPSSIRGYRPDIVAQKGKSRRIIEVETPDSISSIRDKKQQTAFRNTANRSKHTTFTRRVAK